ncbi:hypothetical protein [Croceicoccus sp. Ery5]|jgi:hypothetical protein|uniref:hypothetical protein n=1 Tax=Croceicoccus sp. Ery5 TaxID=1703340 RepID=UPI001E57ECC2|nr:hypothetical protein [Croceicoccus sp. Ery5]
MKRTAIALGLIASAALAAPSAQAQGTTDTNLRCAAWALVASAQEQDQGKRRALGFMMTYFVGRYEQGTGGKIEKQINPQTIQGLVGDVEEANKLCAPLATDFSTRLQAMMDGMQPPEGQTQGR